MTNVIKGRVVEGDGYGRKLGFPTVNLETKDKLPEDGVYAGVAKLEGKTYRAGIIVSKGKIEAHLLDYDGDAYGKEVKLKTKKFLREYQKFDTEERLIEQIKKDIEQC